MIAMPKIIGVIGAIFIVIIGASFVVNSKNAVIENDENTESAVVKVAPTTENTESAVPSQENTTDETKVTSDPVPEPSIVPIPKPTPTPAPAPVTKTGYTLAEVAQHSSQSSCYTIIDDRVYDLTSFIKRHPGGAANIMKVCGKDGTFLFENQHEGDSKPEAKLASFYLGNVVK